MTIFDPVRGRVIDTGGHGGNVLRLIGLGIAAFLIVLLLFSSVTRVTELKSRSTIKKAAIPKPIRRSTLPPWPPVSITRPRTGSKIVIAVLPGGILGGGVGSR